MSGADNPRGTGLWAESVIAARAVLESRLTLTAHEADVLAEAVTERLLGDFLTYAESNSEVVFGMDGTGPGCSWCGRLPGPRLNKDHPQFGVFCDCKRPRPKPGDEEAPPGP